MVVRIVSEDADGGRHSVDSEALVEETRRVCGKR